MSSQINPGQKLGNYSVLAALGAGGMGVVYRARDERLGRDVALKVLPAKLAVDEMARARMLREAQTASSLNHPHICHIYEIGEADGHSFIAMELVEGRPLSASIPAGGMPMDVVIRYGEQMADALEHAHSRNVLHRDIKSSNVVITPEGRVKILDFGLAKRVSEDIANEATLSQLSPLTQAGTIAGTLSYLAPEVLSGHPAESCSDLWALGVVLYEMASGTLPFQGRTSFEVSSAILRESGKPLPPRVSPGLRGVIQRCLAKEPGQRYQRASEVRAALQAIGSGATQPTAEAAPPPSFTPPGERRPGWAIWIVAGAALLVAGFLVWDNFFSAHSRGPLQELPPPAPSSSGAAIPAPPSGNFARLTGGGRASPIPEANEYFEKALLMLRGQFDLQKGRLMVERAIEIDPKFAEARAMYALTLLLNVESGISNESAWVYKSEQEVRRALTDDPNCATCQAILAATYYYQGKTEEGLRAADSGIRLLPDSISANLWKANLLGLKGNFESGVELAQRLVAAQPAHWPARRLLGVMLHESGDRAGALRELEKVLEQDSANVFALCELAHMHIETGDLQTARTFLDRTRAEDRTNYRTRLVRALLRAAERKHKDARKEMDAETLRYAENSPSVTLQAAEFFSLMDDAPQAIAWMERAVRNGDERISWFKANPLLARVRENPRFQQIVDSIVFRRGQK